MRPDSAPTPSAVFLLVSAALSSLEAHPTTRQFSTLDSERFARLSNSGSVVDGFRSTDY